MNRSRCLQELLIMRFEEVYEGWEQGLIDSGIGQISHRRAPVDEIMALTDLYKKYYLGWNIRHFFKFYKEKHDGQRGYTWVKSTLQNEGMVAKGKPKGVHRKKRERATMKGMMLHQDASSHQWVTGKMWDLVITFDDADSEHYSMFFVDEEGTNSSFRGVQETIEEQGVFCSLYTDRGSHYWLTPEANKRVDKSHFTQFRRALHQMGIDMIAAYSPEARGRCERQFRTHQGRLPQELALMGITDMEKANRYLKNVYIPPFNKEFMSTPLCDSTAFVPWSHSIPLRDILCEQFERVVGKDNCVSFDKLNLQIPKDKERCHYMRAKVRVHRYPDQELAIFYGPRKLAEYDSKGNLKLLHLEEKESPAA